MALMGVDVSRDRIKAAESIWDPRDSEATAAVAVFGSSLSQSLVQTSHTQSPPLSSPARKVKQLAIGVFFKHAWIIEIESNEKPPFN